MHQYKIPSEGLTLENYYTEKNSAISNSKVKDFLKSKELFFTRHLAHSMPSDSSPSMLMGSMLDDIVGKGSLSIFKRKYRVKVLKKDDIKAYAKQQKMAEQEPERIISEDIYGKVVKMGDKLIRAPFYKQYKKMKTKFQVPLWNKFETYALHPDSGFKLTPGGIIPNMDVCGLIDMLTFDHKTSTVYIDDLKSTTTSKMRSTQTWYWHCVDMGYIRQLAHYRWLVMMAYPEFEHYICRHVVISNEKADMHPIKLFVIPESLLKPQVKQFFDTAYLISQEERFIDELPTWDSAETLPELLTPPFGGMNDDEGDEMKPV